MKLPATDRAPTLTDRLDDAIESLGSFPDHRDLSPSGRLTERAGAFLERVEGLLRECRAALSLAGEKQP